MPAALTVDAYVTVIRTSGAALIDSARAAGLDAPVPTCPRWTVAHLVAHQAMVHRWATANVRGDDPSSLPGQTALRGRPDLLDHYTEGVGLLADALLRAVDDLAATTFLNDAGTPRTFWARRQAHETTVHAVDAASAVLGRAPTGDEFGLDPTLAADGIDELVRGFFTRGQSKLYTGTPFTMGLVATDTSRAWRLLVAEQLTVATGDVVPQGDEAVVIRGDAASLYLALWNRGSDIEVSGDGAVVQRWRANHRIRWS